MINSQGNCFVSIVTQYEQTLMHGGLNDKLKLVLKITVNFETDAIGIPLVLCSFTHIHHNLAMLKCGGKYCLVDEFCA